MTTVSIHIPQFAQTLETNLGEFVYDAQGAIAYESKLSCDLSLEDAKKIFKGYDLKIVETVIRESRQKILDIHNQLESELDALNAKIN